jgi:hypothetical protein
MHVETKFLRLFRAVELGDDIDGWRVCWLGGWDKCRVLFVVMVERVRVEFTHHSLALCCGVSDEYPDRGGRRARRPTVSTFTIENETSNITIHASAKEAEAVPDAERFGSEAALAKLAANWPAARLAEIWNSLPGTTPVRRFKDRGTGVSRIWKAIQSLGGAVPAEADRQPEVVAITETVPAVPETPLVTDVPEPKAETSAPVAPQPPAVAPEEAPAKTRASRAKKPLTATTASGPREGSKTSRVIELLKREGGVTLKELMTEMGWQSHTTRALMSAGGSLARKHGLRIVSTRGENGERTYSSGAAHINA